MAETRLHERLRSHLLGQIRLFSLQRHWPVLVLVAAGVLISIGSYTWARHQENRDLGFIFEREAQTQMNAVGATIELNLTKARTLGEFIRSIDELTEQKFRIFSEALLAGETGVIALEWAPRVAAEESSGFVEGMRGTFPGYEIRELSASGEIGPAASRQVYYPVALVEPFEANRTRLGLDMMTRPGVAEAMAESAATGSVRSSFPVRLVRDGDRTDGILAFVPVREPDAGEAPGPPPVRGYAIAVCRMRDVLEEAVRPFDDPVVAVRHGLYIQEAPGAYRLAVAEAGLQAPPTLDGAALARIHADPMRLYEQFDILGQQWLGVTQADPDSMAALRTRIPGAILAIGLLLTWIVAGYLWLLTNRAAQIENTVEERTAQLARVNSELQQENARRISAEREMSQVLRNERQAHEAARKAREELAVSEARYRVMGETLPYGVWLFDAEGEPQYFSQSFLDLLGMTLEETRHYGWSRRLAPEEVEPAIDRVRRAIRTGRALEIEHRFLGTDKQYHTVLVRGLPVRDSGGRITSWVGINLDITQRKAAEEELRQHRDYLEELVRSRTLELMMTNEELRHDIERRQQVEEALRNLQENLEEQVRTRTEELAAANRELEAFSYSVSHDLRAPLRHIVGFVQLLHKHSADRLGDSGLRQLQIITNAANRMGRLIDDLLQFSRMGRSAMRVASIPLAPLIDDVRQELQADVNGREVEWVIDPALPPVQADASLLRVVLVNLLSNALKYSRTREKARIEIGLIESGAQEATIFIRDNGVGFDSQYADRLFGVFQRLHKAEEFEGTGIGLAIVQRIVHRHGGRIWAEGAVDQGATFYFSLLRGKESDARLEAHSAG